MASFIRESSDLVGIDAGVNGGQILFFLHSPIGPPTDIIIDEKYATLCSWAEIQESGNVMPEKLTDIAVDL